MADASPIQTAFNGGIFSPLLEGHIDAPRRGSSYSDSTNLIALKQGPLVRRGGMVWVFEDRELSDSRIKLFEFIFNDEQAYLVAFTDSFFRFYRNDSIVFLASRDQTVTGITAASPPVVTVASATGYDAGIPCQITGLSEAVELNDRMFRALNLSGNTFELFEGDGSTPAAAPAVAESSSTGTAQQAFALAVPYTNESDLFDSNGLFIPDIVQSNDVMYIAHGNFATRVLARTADDAWTIVKLKFDNGPFQVQNFSDTTMTVSFVSSRVWKIITSSGDTTVISGATQANPVVVTTSSDHELSSSDKAYIKGVAGMVELNDIAYNITVLSSTTFSLQDVNTDANVDGTGFTAYSSAGTVEKTATVVVPSDTLTAAAGGDANNLGTATQTLRLIRIKDDSPNVWRWGRITKYVNAVEFQVTIDDAAKDLTAIAGGTAEWALGAYSDTTGYPSVTSIHEGRLVFGATSSEPRRIDFSAIAGFNPTSTDFIPSDEDGIVRPDDSIGVTIGGGSANPITWIDSISQGLAVGTIAAEGLIRSSSNSESLTPENATYKKSSTAGSTSIQPLAIGNALIHVQFIRRRLQELTFNFQRDGFQSFDMTELAEHLTREKIVDIAYQQQPIETIWVLLGNGTLLGFTYERNADVLGWHRHVIGGVDVDINSIAVIPSNDLSRDELWMAVTRTVAGLTTPVRTYIERMERFYEDDIIQEHAYHQDSGRIYRTAEIVITGVTQFTSNAVTTAANHGQKNGDSVYIRGIEGMSQLNGNTYMVSGVTSITLNKIVLADPSTSLGTKITITGATQADPVVVTAVGHGRANGDDVRITGVIGMVELNNDAYKIKNITVDTMELTEKPLGGNLDGTGFGAYVSGGVVQEYDPQIVDTTGFDAYVSGGTAQESVSTFRALDHLEGETVQVYVDGRTHADKTVTLGAVTLDDGITGANVSIGLANEWTFESHRVEVGSALGTSQGKIKRFSQVIFRLFKTLGFQSGADLDGTLDEEPFTYGTDPDSMTPLFTGDLPVNWPGGYETEGRIVAKGVGPFPAQIQSFMPQVKTSEKPR